MSSNAGSRGLQTLVAISTVLGTCIAAIALIPSFGQWLSQAGSSRNAVSSPVPTQSDSRSPTLTNSLPVSQASQTTPLGVAPTDISGEWVGRLDGNTGPLSYLMTLVQIGQQVEGTAYAQDLANQQVHVLFKLRGQVNDSIFHFEEYAITDSNPPYGWCLIAGNLALATSANRSVLSGDWAAADKGDPNCTILGKLRLTKTK